MNASSTRRWRAIKGRLFGQAGPSKMMGGGSDEGGGRGKEKSSFSEFSFFAGLRRPFVVDWMSSLLWPSREGASKISKMGGMINSSGSAAVDRATAS